MTSNASPTYDAELAGIADYAMHYEAIGAEALVAARYSLFDTLACAFDALNFSECRNALAPMVPGMILAQGARVPGTGFELDPANAAFSLGCMIRWLDLNDAFSGAQGSHPSDNLAGILMLADYLSRQRLIAGGNPLRMRDVLVALIKAYEVQGCLALANDFSERATGMDQALLTRVASAAVLTTMLGGTREQVLSAVSNAWIDASLLVFRRAPNTNSRKNWACADAVFQAMRLAFMACKGEPGYPTVLTAPQYGFYDARFGGKAFQCPRPYEDYVIRNSMFKCVPGAMLSQSAVECAFRLHSLVKQRLDQVVRVDIRSQRPMIAALDKSGPLRNAADRDHCAQYMIALGLIYGCIRATDFGDTYAADPRIDALRSAMSITEEPRYTRDFHDPGKRSCANAVQVHFKDGSSTARIEIEYPLGHPSRRPELAPALRAKLEDSLRHRFSFSRSQALLEICDDFAKLEHMPVNEFVDLLV